MAPGAHDITLLQKGEQVLRSGLEEHDLHQEPLDRYEARDPMIALDPAGLPLPGDRRGEYHGQPVPLLFRTRMPVGGVPVSTTRLGDVTRTPQQGSSKDPPHYHFLFRPTARGKFNDATTCATTRRETSANPTRPP